MQVARIVSDFSLDPMTWSASVDAYKTRLVSTIESTLHLASHSMMSMAAVKTGKSCLFDYGMVGAVEMRQYNGCTSILLRLLCSTWRADKTFRMNVVESVALGPVQLPRMWSPDATPKWSHTGFVGSMDADV
jgi:hypothetical protein